MNEMSEREIDELLTRHLGACLNGQLGRAEAAFAREPNRPTPGRLRLWLSAVGAVAAGIAVAWFTVVPRPEKVPDAVTGQEPSIAVVDPAPPMLQSAAWSKVVDDGCGVVDDRPVRRLRRRVVEEIEWYDAKAGAVVRTTQPRQQVFLIGMKAD